MIVQLNAVLWLTLLKFSETEQFHVINEFEFGINKIW